MREQEPRTYWNFCWAILLVTLVPRLARMGDSIWLDESWVANSILEPSVHGMLFFERWVQSTPPLLLLLIRALTTIAGFSEPVLRVIPALCGLLGLGVLAGVLRRAFLPLTALAGFALIASNYWLLKYAQQLKQYGPDFLVSCLALLAIERCLRQYRSRMLAVLALGGITATLFAFTAVFWYVPCILAASIRQRGKVLSVAVIPALFLSCALGVIFGLEYLTYIRVNAPPLIYKDLVSDFFSFVHPFASVAALVRMLGQLLTGGTGRVAAVVGTAASLVVIAGAGRAYFLARKQDFAAVLCLLGGVLPLASVILVSGLGQYPILGYPRMLIWALPSLALLICLIIDPFVTALVGASLTQGYRKYVASAMALIPILGCALYLYFPNAVEENAAAVKHLRTQIAADDLLFVHGGMYEQFRYYERRAGWVPSRVYVGNTNWPCCALNVGQRASDPRAETFSADVKEALGKRKAKPRGCCFLVPDQVIGARVWLACLLKFRRPLKKRGAAKPPSINSDRLWLWVCVAIKRLVPLPALA